MGTSSVLVGWEGNRRSGVALTVRHGLYGTFTHELSSLWQENEHLAYASLYAIVWHPVLLIFYLLRTARSSKHKTHDKNIHMQKTENLQLTM